MDEFYIKGIYPFTEQFQQDAKARVIADGGTFENETSILEKASAIWRPNGTKAGKLYALRPSNGNGDFTVTRNTTATETDKDGVVQTVLANVPRIDWSLGYPVVLLEPQRTNSVRNSTAVGAVVGSPGTLPTGWTSSIAGMSREVVGLGTENGLAYIDVRISGTNASTTCVISFIQPNVQSAASGQVWSASCYAKLISAPLAPLSYNIHVVEWNGGSFLTATTASLALSSSLRRFEVSRTLNNASTNGVTTYVSFGVLNGQSYDFTVRLAAPQLELGAFATSFIPTFGSSTVTRNVDAVTRNNVYTNGLITAIGGTWFVDLRANVAYAGNTLAQKLGLGNNANGAAADNFWIGTSVTSRLLIWKQIAGVLTNLYTTPSDSVKIAIKWNGSTANIFANGTKVVADTAFTAVALETLRTFTVESPYRIKEMALYTSPLTDAECIQLTVQ